MGLYSSHTLFSPLCVDLSVICGHCLLSVHNILFYLVRQHIVSVKRECREVRGARAAGTNEHLANNAIHGAKENNLRDAELCLRTAGVIDQRAVAMAELAWSDSVPSRVTRVQHVLQMEVFISCVRTARPARREQVKMLIDGTSNEAGLCRLRQLLHPKSLWRLSGCRRGVCNSCFGERDTSCGRPHVRLRLLRRAPWQR